MSHGKCGTRVVSSAGVAWTTRRGAARLISAGLGDRGPDGAIYMRESDHRFNCESRGANAPSLEMESGLHLVAAGPTCCSDCHKDWIPDGDWGVCPEGKAA